MLRCFSIVLQSFLLPSSSPAITQTDMLRKVEGTWVLISESQALKELKIDQHSLREWKQNKRKILAMKKGAKRDQGGSYGREHEMKVCLNKEFNTARAEGQAISSH